jgi:hypothetical protein
VVKLPDYMSADQLELVEQQLEHFADAIHNHRSVVMVELPAEVSESATDQHLLDFSGAIQEFCESWWGH